MTSDDTPARTLSHYQEDISARYIRAKDLVHPGMAAILRQHLAQCECKCNRMLQIYGVREDSRLPIYGRRKDIEITLRCYDLACLQWWDEKALVEAASIPIPKSTFANVQEPPAIIERRISLAIRGGDFPSTVRPYDGLTMLRKLDMAVCPELEDAVLEFRAWHLYGPKPDCTSTAQGAGATASKALGKTQRETLDSLHWKMRVQAKATAHALWQYEIGCNPTISSLARDMAKWCHDNNVTTDNGINPTAGYLRNHVLSGKHWKMPDRPRN